MPKITGAVEVTIGVSDKNNDFCSDWCSFFDLGNNHISCCCGLFGGELGKYDEKKVRDEQVELPRCAECLATFHAP